MTERTLLLVKPDGVQRQLVGRIIGRFEERGLKIVGLKLVAVDTVFAETHYAVHRDKPFFAGLVAFITSGPLVAMALEGPNAIGMVRSMVGATRPHEAAPGSIRGDLAVETAQNCPRVRRPGDRRRRARAVVRARRARGLRPRDRPLGARPGTLISLPRAATGHPARSRGPRRRSRMRLLRRGPRAPRA